MVKLSSWSVDARVPVLVATDIGDGDVGLVEGVDFEPGAHPAGCACCGVRSPVAVALDQLFLRRVRGEVPFFRRVVVRTRTPDGDVALWDALRNDAVVAARFRPG